MHTTDTKINLAEIESLYRQLNISTIETVDIEKLSKEYRESMAFIEKETIATSAYINR